MRVVGIDVGKQGGLCVIENGELVASCSLSQLQVDLNKVKTRKPVQIVDADKLLKQIVYSDHVFVEQVAAGSGQGVSSMFSFGMQFASVLSVCMISGVPFTLVRPQEWQKVILERGLVREYYEGTKQRTKDAAVNAFNDSVLLRKPKGRKPFDGLCDASLIGLWGYWHLMSESSSNSGGLGMGWV